MSNDYFYKQYSLFGSVTFLKKYGAITLPTIQSEHLLLIAIHFEEDKKKSWHQFLLIKESPKHLWMRTMLQDVVVGAKDRMTSKRSNYDEEREGVDYRDAPHLKLTQKRIRKRFKQAQSLSYFKSWATILLSSISEKVWRDL